VDCQAAGATPVHGDLLELGWAFCSEAGLHEPIRAHWIRPRTERPITRAVRMLTGWSEARLAEAVHDHEAWAALRGELAAIHADPQTAGTVGVPTLIHYARFELPFLRDLHARTAPPDATFPLEICCLHAIAVRLFPDLPRRNIRALAGFLGHSTELVRQSSGHVAASASIWRALVPHLENQGVHTWDELQTWLANAPKMRRRSGRVYPLPQATRRNLPDAPGVYRFVRSNGSVLYVGKAASLKKRMAGHFSRRGPSNERGLELLSQVHDIAITQTESVLEAAVLETDEIKRLDPPYNVQLRKGERHAWFASRDLRAASHTPDAQHVHGPLPSQRALLSFAALCELAAGSEAAPALCAWALAVPSSELPEPALFRTGFEEFLAQHLADSTRRGPRHVAHAALRLFLVRGRAEAEAANERDDDTAEWDLARVKRRLERALVHGGLLLRRARLLRLLADCDLAFQERAMVAPRLLRVRAGQLSESAALAHVRQLVELPARAVLRASERRSCFDAAAYDRMRVLTTELNRVLQEGGEVGLRVGSHTYLGARAHALLRGV